MVPDVQRFRLVSPRARPLHLAYDAFLIAQEAAQHSPLTLKWYEQRLGRFVQFLIERAVQAPQDIIPTHCRAFLVSLTRNGLKDITVRGYAQAVKTFCRFLEREEFALSNAMLHAKMPKVAKRIPKVFSPDEVKRLSRQAGVPNCSPHAFRRTCATWSLRAGMSVYHLQAIMGHSDIQVLRHYLSLVEADARDVHRRFGPVDNML